MTQERRSSQRPPHAVEVRAPARLHLGMLSFGAPDVRSFGGVGVMVDRPGVHVRLRRAEAFVCRGPLAGRALQFARDAAATWGLDAREACEIDVLATPRAHVGLGSGTQLALAVAAGMHHLHRAAANAGELAPGTSADGERAFTAADVLELARAVGRGRRSCVGIHGFSRGGLIVEAGRFVPSRSPEDGCVVSPMVARVRLPSSWRCVVIIQRDAVGLHGDEEKRAFQALAPVPREITAELARIALMEILPAAVEGGFAAFSEAVRRYGDLAGKPFAPASERLPHAAATARLIALLGELGIRGAAQSSWGPAVMACCESPEAADALMRRFDALELTRDYEPILARFDSQGATLRVLE